MYKGIIIMILGIARGGIETLYSVISFEWFKMYNYVQASFCLSGICMTMRVYEELAQAACVQGCRNLRSVRS